MIRLLLRLLGITDYDTCKSCDTLKHQLAMVNEEKKMLTETLLRLVKPEVIHQAPVTVVTPKQVFNTFTKRRAELERSHRNAQDARVNSSFIAKPSSSTEPVKSETVEDMEARLGLTEITEVDSNAS